MRKLKSAVLFFFSFLCEKNAQTLVTMTAENNIHTAVYVLRANTILQSWETAGTPSV